MDFNEFRNRLEADVGKNAEGKTIWQAQRSKVSNRDLKKMVEAYKERSRESHWISSQSRQKCCSKGR